MARSPVCRSSRPRWDLPSEDQCRAVKPGASHMLPDCCSVPAAGLARGIRSRAPRALLRLVGNKSMRGWSQNVLRPLSIT